MFVPSFKKFKLYDSTNHYVKRIKIEDKLYDINIPKEEWTKANMNKMHRFLKKENILSIPPPCNSFITAVENTCGENECEFSGVDNKVRNQLQGVKNIRTYNDSATTNVSGDSMEEFDEHELGILNAYRTILNERMKKIINEKMTEIEMDEESKKKMKKRMEMLLLDKDILERQSD